MTPMTNVIKMWLALSPRQAYYHLYNLISLNALKAYILEQFTYLARNLNKGFVKQIQETSRRAEQFTFFVFKKLILFLMKLIVIYITSVTWAFLWLQVGSIDTTRL